jgi:glutamine amidotransferase
MNIVIIDYGMGNPLSIKNMLLKIGIESEISCDVNILNLADKLILPGVGHFTSGIKNIKEKNLFNLLNFLVLEKKVPILGICLGMQLMTRKSDESDLPGFGWIEASTNKFDFEDKSIKVPHMGWTDTQFKNSIIQENLFEENPPRFYFVHSYYVQCDNLNDIQCESEYGIKFTSGFVKGNIMGVQFHPEKSHIFGQSFLNQFIEWNPNSE